jgi:hypothetical protein
LPSRHGDIGRPVAPGQHEIVAGSVGFCLFVGGLIRCFFLRLDAGQALLFGLELSYLY